MDEQTKADNENTAPKSELPPVSTANIGQVNPKRDAQNSNYDRKKSRKPLSAFECWTIGLAIAGIVVAGLTGAAIYWQAKIGVETLGEVKKGGADTHILAEAAKAQADAAKSSADIQRSVYIAANRPYVGIWNPLAGRDDRQKILTINFSVKNFGSVPAEDFFCDWQMRINGKPVPPNYPFRQGANILSPGATVVLVADLRNEVFDAVISGKQFLDIEIVSDYRGPAGHYDYCIKERYFTDLNSFVPTATSGCTFKPRMR